MTRALPADRTIADPQLLAAFNRGFERSRAAYRADLATAQGLCVVCEVNKPGGFVRTCVKCRSGKRGPS